MKDINTRKTFLRHLLSFMAFSAGTGLSFKKSMGGSIYGTGPASAHAATITPKDC